MSDAAAAKPLRTAEWVATRLGISKWQVYELAKRSEIHCVKLGRLVRFDEETIEAFIRGGGTGSRMDGQVDRTNLRILERS